MTEQERMKEVQAQDLDVRTSSPEFEKEFDWLLNLQELKT